jgi:hypothetical protein
MKPHLKIEKEKEAEKNWVIPQRTMIKWSSKSKL